MSLTFIYEKVIAWKQCVFVNIVAIGNHWSLSLVSGAFSGPSDESNSALY